MHFTQLLQLQFNSFDEAHLAPDEVVLCNTEKLVLSPIWCDYIWNKLSIREGVEVQLHLKSYVVAPSLDLQRSLGHLEGRLLQPIFNLN